MSDTFRCYYVTKADGADDVQAEIARRPVDELPPGDVVVRVQCSSLNYKDALGATGHPGVNKSFPYVPGVDAAGVIEHVTPPDESAARDSTSPNTATSNAETTPPPLEVGMPVIVTGYDMGVNRWGGWGERIRVPRGWVVPCPPAMSPRVAMSYGTAGFTAALCVEALRHNGVVAGGKPVLVTGASGGVGTIGVAILAKLGYEVVAVTSKPEWGELLRRLGATEIVGRDAVDVPADRPLLSRRYAGGLDTVGGIALSTMLRSIDQRGCVAACGNAAGADLPITVFPFILRGVTLAGIDASQTPWPVRAEMWRRLAEEWRVDDVERIVTAVGLDDLQPRVHDMLASKTQGRTVVEIE